MGKNKKKFSRCLFGEEVVIPVKAEPGAIVRIQESTEEGKRYYIIVDVFSKETQEKQEAYEKSEKPEEYQVWEIQINYLGQEGINFVLERNVNVSYIPNVKLSKYVGIMEKSIKKISSEVIFDGIIGKISDEMLAVLIEKSIVEVL